MILGHEVVGTVIGATADGTGPAEGARVAVHPATREHIDVRVPENSPNLSPGVRDLGSAARFPHTEGAFAGEVVLPSGMLRELPAGLDLRVAALAEPASDEPVAPLRLTMARMSVSEIEVETVLA
jgi:L-idonate 5-dehydrogenase